MTTICHFSDWHGMWQDLPEADIYICTGDMLPNSLGHTKNWLYEEDFQHKFMRDNPIVPPSRNPVYCVRGNHEHVRLAGLFPKNRVVEFCDRVSISHDHKYVGFDVIGIPGVKRIKGNGPDEIPLHELDEKVNRVAVTHGKSERPVLLLSHAPPYQIMDHVKGSGEYEHSGDCGSPGLLKLSRRSDIVAHFFGHIHERKGIRNVGDTLYSNAATGINMIEL